MRKVERSADRERFWVVVPAFNEAAVIGEVLSGLLAEFPNLVLVDDGSSDDTFSIAARYPVHRLRHPVNLGQGAALQTGIDHALEQGAGFVACFDADGQMDPGDLVRLCETLVEGPFDVALGTRFGGRPAGGMPPLRRGLLRLAVVYTRLTTGLGVTDTHNGMRAFTREAAARVRIRSNRMAHASEILAQIRRHRMRYTEVPITVRYTEYSLGKGQRSRDLLDILWETLFHG